MKNLIFVLYVIAAWTYSFAKSDVSTKTFKSKKYGFEFSYPSNWVIESDQGGLEPDEEVPIEEDSSLNVLDRERYINRKCERNCQVHIDIYPESASHDEYDKSVKNIEKYRLTQQEGTLRRYIRSSEDTLNSYNIVYIVERKGDISKYFKITAYLFCTEVNRILRLANEINFDGKKDFYSNENIPLNLETVFYPEQIPIIKSIKCPPKDFVYKPEKKK